MGGSQKFNYERIFIEKILRRHAPFLSFFKIMDRSLSNISLIGIDSLAVSIVFQTISCSTQWFGCYALNQ